MHGLLGFFEESFFLHACYRVSVDGHERHTEFSLECCFVDAARGAEGEERELFHADGARRGLFLRARELAAFDGVDVGRDVLRVFVADAIEVGVRRRAEAEVRLVLPIAEVVAALAARAREIRNLVACIAVRGERRRHEVVHRFCHVVIG